MANVPTLSDFTQTTVSTPSAPSTTSKFDLDAGFARQMIREIVAEGVIEEPKLAQELSSARSFFSGDQVFKTNTIFENLEFGQQVRVNIEKDQNPFGLYQKSSLNYTAVDSCHDQISLDCTVPCINTLPTIQHIVFRFDTEYAYGVRACDKNKDFWDFNYFAKQYALSRRAEQFGRELDLWNTVIPGLIAAPATTVDAALAVKRPTHYWSNLGTVTASARATVGQAVRYMTNAFESVNLTGFCTEEFATELIKSVENPYNLNINTQIARTYEQWSIPGFQLEDTVKTILGINIPVVTMKRSPWLTTSATVSGATTLTSKYPLWNAAGTKQYFAILDPRVGYQIAKDGYHLDIRPYDCDKLTVGMTDTEYVGSGITFPVYGLILEYTATQYA